MIVVGATHVSLVGRLFRRTVSDTVAHRARCDVLIVH